MSDVRADLDSPWKDILRSYFPQAIAFFFPETDALIDWGKPHEFLDKEFQQVSQDAELGRRYADQLVKVFLKGSKPLWLLLHLGVQNQSETDFEERMFTYCIRIFDQFRQIPISLAILCDESLSWRPHEYEFRLTRALDEKGFGRQEVLDLYRFIDWVMILPEAIERKFWQELQAFEEERKVTYVTNAERFGIEKGIEQGIEQGMIQGERSLILRLLFRRVGILSSEMRSQIESLPLEQLESLGEALLDFSAAADLDKWLRLH